MKLICEVFAVRLEDSLWKGLIMILQSYKVFFFLSFGLIKFYGILWLIFEYLILISQGWKNFQNFPSILAHAIYDGLHDFNLTQYHVIHNACITPWIDSMQYNFIPHSSNDHIKHFVTPRGIATFTGNIQIKTRS